MGQRLYVKIREEDNVVIAVKDILAGTMVMEETYSKKWTSMSP